jgi:hypothetical protein
MYCIYLTAVMMGSSCVSSCSVHGPLSVNLVAGPERLMDDTVSGGGIVQRVSRLVLTCTCLRRTWHEALSCPVWIDCHVHMSGFRNDLSSYHKVVAMHT